MFRFYQKDQIIEVESVLYLDDVRKPLLLYAEWARNYDQFVEYLSVKNPDLISFDHDLSFEHYCFKESRPTTIIPYNNYIEKTGYDCAKYIIENKIPIKYWACHSFNPVGKANIINALLKYLPEGYIPNLNIPYKLLELEEDENI